MLNPIRLNLMIIPKYSTHLTLCVGDRWTFTLSDGHLISDGVILVWRYVKPNTHPNSTQIFLFMVFETHDVYLTNLIFVCKFNMTCGKACFWGPTWELAF